MVVALGGSAQVYEHPPAGNGQLIPRRCQRRRWGSSSGRRTCARTQTVPQVAVLH